MTNGAATVYLPEFDFDPPTGIVEFGHVRIDLEQRALLRDGAEVAVGGRAFDILAVLVRARGRLVTKSDLMNAIWPQTFVEENNLQVHLSSLRRALGGDRDLVVTVPGRGYRLAWRESPGPCPCMSHDAPLIGRERALDQIVALLSRFGAVTLVGAGGVGKSMLAFAAARRFAADGQRTVHHVPLAELEGGEAVICAIAEHFPAFTDRADADIVRLAQCVAEDRGLLFLDDAEHVIEPIAAFIDTLRAFGGRVLVTSREPLRVMSETLYRVDPLDVPEGCDDASRCLACPSVRLFLARASAVCGSFDSGAERVCRVAEICRRLEGNPLAIELAASRLDALSLEDIEAGLERRLTLLVGGHCQALARHRGLRANFDWSHAMLDAGQRALFRRIAVFEGRFTFDDMCAAARREGLTRAAVVDAVSDLVAKALLRMHPDDGGVRYSLSESTRLYALEKLEAIDAGLSMSPATGRGDKLG
jgi:predicted ATPase